MLPPAVTALACDLSLRALEQQERFVDELRARTGTLLAASTVAASFLAGRVVESQGFEPATALALLAFTLSILSCIYILLPKPTLVFALHGSALLDDAEVGSEPITVVQERLAYWIDGYRDDNEVAIARLSLWYRRAALALVAEVVILSVQLSGIL